MIGTGPIEKAAQSSDGNWVTMVYSQLSLEGHFVF